MEFDWEVLRPSTDLRDSEKGLIRRISEAYLEHQSATPVKPLRAELGPERRYLDRLVQDIYIRNVAEHYYPAFLALYFVKPQLRKRTADGIEAVLTALNRLYRNRRGADRFTLGQIVSTTTLGPTILLDMKAARISAQFLRDFPMYFAAPWNSIDVPIAGVSLTEGILDFENLQQAWRDEAVRRKSPQSTEPPLSSAPVPSGLSEVPLAGESLAFVSDAQLKTILKRDIEELQVLRGPSVCKLRIIQSGSIIEGLLLDALLPKEQTAIASLRNKGKKKSGLDECDLDDLIEIAVEMKVITKGTMSLAHGVRKYRNLVHPGLEKRSDYRVGANEANIAEQVLEMVVRDLKEAAKSPGH
jgi:hypothetical protein